ncbi:GTP-binding protein 128up [Portunus trituberculatus]|uniref:GTP-binding protein 128up n=1 Tax=Portunus trituberculatus TaxID=210409 RepID=A0A5B7E018_PORTR|nr:GTP-binding protein 128up [Portunus trituberculatus]
MSILQKIADIEAEMARTQKNKATMGHLGLLKAKLAKLKRELITPKGGGATAGEGFDVAKTGDARIGFVGFPSVGKSTLLSNLAGVYSEVAAYEFTTLTTVPGCIKYKGAKIQLLDLPGIIEGAKDGKGRGKQVIAVARTCSLIFIVLDVLKPIAHKKLIEKELEGFGIRLNKEPPQITFRKKEKGGVNLQCAVQQNELDLELVKTILAEYRIHNADIVLKYDATADDLIDVIEGNRVYIPCIYLLNKIATPNQKDNFQTTVPLLSCMLREELLKTFATRFIDPLFENSNTPWFGEAPSSTSHRKWGKSMFSMMKMWSRFAKKSRINLMVKLYIIWRPSFSPVVAITHLLVVIINLPSSSEDSFTHSSREQGLFFEDQRLPWAVTMEE